MFTEIFTLLSGTLFFVCFLFVYLRFLLQFIGADFYNQASQIVVKATDPVLAPLRKIIPGTNKIDVAAIVLLIFIKLLETGTKQIIAYGEINSFYFVFASAIISLVAVIIQFYFVAIFAQIILSWIAPQNYNPIVALLHQITEPIMQPVRKIVPPMGGLDFSPIIVFLGLQILEILLVSNKGILPLLFSTIGSML